MARGNGSGFGLEPEALGVDSSPERRPGVPMEAEPAIDPGAHWRQPERQWVRRKHYKRKGLAHLTPVFGNAVPPRGLSGVMRRVAYGIPEHKARHWGLLIAADRVDVLEGRLGRLLARPLRNSPAHLLARQAEKNPTRLIALTALGALTASIALRRLLR